MCACRDDSRDGEVVLLRSPRACPGCAETLEHTADKLFYCRVCCHFFIEMDGTIEYYLVNPGEMRRPDRLITTPTAA
jgi:hypothetical protein